MSLWLTAARATVAMNLGLLLILGGIWLQRYRQHGAAHTLGLLVVAAFLLVENALWGYFYAVHPDFIYWFTQSGSDIQMGVTMLCGLEFVALLALVRLTWI